MRSLTSPGLVLAVAVALVALPAAASGAPSGKAAPARIAANEVSYEDSQGEDPNAPDITTIVVSNNDAGMLSFRVNIPNRPTLGQDMIIELYVDSDNNAQTGDPDLAGADYVMQVVRGEINLYRWDGTDYTRRFGDPSAVTLTFAYQAGVTIRISANELGQTRAFKFVTFVISGCTVDPATGALDCANAVGDAAPGEAAGLYAYEVKVARPTLVVRRVATTPATPRAGKRFTMRMVTARSDTGAVLQGGRVSCVGRAGNTRLRAAVARVTGGAVTCTWLIPKNAKGKQFRGTATVVFEGLRASRSISRRIA